ncbi:hypothetical protein RND81_09G198100 [Saponaria officinalis]|uniref:Uncharacterized protein n=1 Tax=Saponaria officinalis TaxID=3572 RepID=A0AAW1IQM4_SAPOF
MKTDKLGVGKSVIEIVIQAPPLSINVVNNDVVLKTTSYAYYKYFITSILANFHAGYFRISLSLCAQVLLWNTLVRFTKERHDRDQIKSPTTLASALPSTASTLLWCIALAVLLVLSLLYVLRCLLHFDKVKAEFLDDVGVNYLFAPSISSLFLLQSSPFNHSIHLEQVACFVCVMPIIMLDIKIYGQWFTKGKRYLSKMANPTCQMSVIANLVAAKVAMYIGWAEMSLCLFSLGMVHYLVLFVTLYQRLPESNGVSHLLRPVFFLFFATPSMASLAWSSINGTFDHFSKMLFFLSVFLFLSLICRPNMFKKSMKKMNIAWWAYSFPLTLLALSSIHYADAVNHGFARAFAFALSVVSVLVSLSLMLLTSFNFNLLFLDTQPASNLS